MGDYPELTPRQTAYVAARMTAPNIAEAARLANVPERTARRWERLEAIRAALAQQRAALLDSAASKAAAYLPAALDTLKAVMDRPKAADRDKIAAARAILMAAPALLQQQASQQTDPNEADELAPDLDTLKARFLSRPLDPNPEPNPNGLAPNWLDRWTQTPQD